MQTTSLRSPSHLARPATRSREYRPPRGDRPICCWADRLVRAFVFPLHLEAQLQFLLVLGWNHGFAASYVRLPKTYQCKTRRKRTPTR